MQAFGFGPADVSFLYEARSLGKNYETAVMRKRSELLLDRYIGLTTGDRDFLRRADERINTFRKAYPRLMSGDTLNRSYKSRFASEREYISGIRFNSSFRDQLEPFFRTLENVTYSGGIVS